MPPLSVQSKYLEEGGLAALADGVDAELVEAAGRRDGCVVVGAGLGALGGDTYMTYAMERGGGGYPK